MYLVLVTFVLFSTVQQVVLFDLYQNRFLHVYHSPVQRFRSPIYINIREMAYNIKENREERKKDSDSKKEKENDSNTPCFCLVRHVLIIKKRMRKKAKAQSTHMFVSK